jgi:hypothetical protein
MRVALAIGGLALFAASASADISIDDPHSGREQRNVRLEHECANQLAAHDGDFRRCWELYQHSDYTGGHRKPFFDLTVAHDGQVTAMVHFATDTAKTRECVRAVVTQFKFTPFSDEESARLGIIEYPSRCRVKDPKTPPDKQAPPPP